MIVILKPIFDWLIGNFSVSSNLLYNYVVMGIIGLTSFAISWRLVGKLYQDHEISGRALGSIIHWFIRLIVFLILFSLVSTIIWLTRAVSFIPTWIWLVLLGTITVTLVALLVRYFYMKRK